MHTMREAPSVLVVHDGELDAVIRVLRQLGADFEPVQGDDVLSYGTRPRDILISTWKRGLELPAEHQRYR